MNEKYEKHKRIESEEEMKKILLKKIPKTQTRESILKEIFSQKNRKLKGKFDEPKARINIFGKQ